MFDHSDTSNQLKSIGIVKTFTKYMEFYAKLFSHCSCSKSLFTKTWWFFVFPKLFSVEHPSMLPLWLYHLPSALCYNYCTSILYLILLTWFMLRIDNIEIIKTNQVLFHRSLDSGFWWICWDAIKMVLHYKFLSFFLLTSCNYRIRNCINFYLQMSIFYIIPNRNIEDEDEDEDGRIVNVKTIKLHTC